MEKHCCKNSILFFIIAFAFLFCSKAVSQSTKNIQFLKQKFITADSIVLISHQITEDYAIRIVPDWDANYTSMNLQKWEALHPTPPPFLIKGKLNKQIVIESITLNDSNKIRLSKILLRQVNLRYWTPSKCYQPQHTIIFYKGNSQSFIDVCFGCKGIHSSKDIAFDEMNTDKRKWAELIAFFKKNGLTKVFKGYEKIGID